MYVIFTEREFFLLEASVTTYDPVWSVHIVFDILQSLK